MQVLKLTSRREFLRLTALGAAGTAVIVACAPAAPTPTVVPAKPAEAPKPAAAPTVADKPAVKAAPQVEITYLVHTGLPEAFKKGDAEMVRDFQARNPNITINVVGVPWGDYNAKLLAMFAAGAAPEVSVSYAAGFLTFYNNKAIQPIDQYVEGDKLDISFLNAVAIRIVTREGKLWGMPVEIMPYTTFYRPDLFEKAGLERPPVDWGDKSWTLDRMFTMASKIAKDTGDPTKAVYGWVMHAQQLGNIAWLWGADPFNDKGGPELSEAYKTSKITEVHFTQPKMVECFQHIVDLSYKHKVSPKPSDTQAMQQSVGWPFLTGKIGMYMEGQWQIGTFPPGKADWKYAMAPYPYGPYGQNTVPAGDNTWFLGAKCKQPEAGWKFVRYVGLEEGAVIHAKMMAAFPANAKTEKYWFDDIQRGPLDMKREDLEKVAHDSLKYAFPMPGKTLDRFPELNRIFTQTTGPIWSGEKSVKEGLEACQKAFEQFIKTTA